ncbi:MAG TPA: tetratricopeptide repeat protein [Blastocatellia bacterium]|nr:tetratricopeptide repeat protein [Blastocatellia bacterium]
MTELVLLIGSVALASPREYIFISPPFSSPPASAGTVAQKELEVRTLEAGKATERELSGGEAHSYQLTLTAGQYARVGVDQRGINVSMSAFDPDGKKITEADMFSIGDSELVSLVAETPGTYRLEVRSSFNTAPKGKYEIKINELRTATERDKNLVAAERLIAEGTLLGSKPTSDFWRQSIEKYQRSIPFCQSAKDPAWEATALYLISNAYISLGEKEKAFDFANQALPIAQAAAKQTLEEQRVLGIKVLGITLDTIGRVHLEFGDKKKALELFDQALPLKRSIGDRGGEVITLNNIGMSYGYMGDWPKAIEFFVQARLIVGELGDRGREAALLNNLCVIHSDLGEYKKAIDFCDKSISIRHDLKDQLGEATALSNVGSCYSSLGEYQKALDFYNQALAIRKGSGDPKSEAIELNNIGWVYATLGEYQKGIGFYNQALEIFRAKSDQYREANVLNNIAVSYANLKDFPKALEINQKVLGLRRALNHRDGEAITLNNIASCYSNLGEKQKALDYYNQSIALHREVGNRRQLATSLRNIGALYRDLGEYQKALDGFNEGLQLSRTIGDRNNEAGLLAQLAGLERDRGNIAEARKRIEEALAAIESLRVGVKSQQLRASFLASVRKYYELDIDVLMRLHSQRPTEGFDAAGLEASERSRARSLLELLAEARAEIRQGVDSSLLERELQLRQVIGDKAERQIRLLGGKHTEQSTAIAAKEIDALTTEYEQVQARIRQTSPRFSALTQPLPLNLKDIQGNLLDDETVLLEYALGEERSFLWTVTRSSIKSFELPKRQDVEAAVRRLYEVLTARNQVVKNETLDQRSLRVAASDAEYPSAAASLSNMLLKPAASQLGTKRLLIVGEGLLQYLPFAGLPVPTNDERNQINKGSTAVSSLAYRPLIFEHEIVNLPSASVLALLRQETAGRKPAPKTLAVLADPVFQSDDPRLTVASNRPPAGQQGPPSGDVYRSATESGLEGFVRLRFSRQEADEITRLAPAAKRLAALDFVASRTTATSPTLAEYRIVHFATHGLINNQHPELSGIVLSLVDEKGQPQNGFLRLYEIYNLKLEADLVVLSACQTALGKEIKGEGLVGLTRGFMYAGAPRVVSSLWQVDDRATAELMKRFYQGILGQGLRPAAALRAAQISMQNETRWRAPHYWAAFTLQGEWK